MSVFQELNFSRKRRLPVVRAVELAECGLACMAMIASYYGHDIDLNGLRQRYPVSVRGATLRHLMSLCDQLGFSSRAIKVDLSHLSKVQTPAVLHWDLNHFVVLKRANGRDAIIHDPSRGEISLSYTELSSHFTGVALEVFPSATFKKIVAREPIRLTSLWSRMTGFWSSAGQILALSAVLQVAAFAAPFQIQLVVDQAIGRSDMALLNVLALGFGCLILIQACVEAIRGWSLQIFSSLLTYQVVGNLVRHLMKLPTEFFEKRSVGDIMSRMNSTLQIQDILAKGLISSIIDGAMAIVAIAIMFSYSIELTLVVIATVVIQVAVSLCAYPIIRSRTDEQLNSSAVERSHVMETIRAATTIKLMGGEFEREGAWRNLYARTINATIGISKIQIVVGLAQAILTGGSAIVVVYLGAKSIISGDGLSIGMLLAFLSFRQTFSDRAISLVNQSVQLRLVSLYLERLSDLVCSAPEASGEAVPLADTKGEIEFRSVSFSYGPNDPLILSRLDLKIGQGEFVALTGPSGGGKTTLVKVLLGLHTPKDGDVILDGRAATTEYWRAWRSHVGIVAQDDRLISGTIADNIAFFDPLLDMALVQDAARRAAVHEEIETMPMQYLSLIGDMGSALSGGQKQRVLLARALYRNPKILVLDEGTANLDQETERVIADLISNMPITRIVVAHRPALVERADRVLWMAGGILREIRPNSPHEVS